MAKRKKKKKKSKKTKKTRRKSRKNIRTRKKSRVVKKTRKSKSKKRKKSKSKSRKTKPRKLNFKAPKIIEDGDGRSLIKVSDSWANHAYVNESKYKKNINFQSKIMINFGQKKEKELLGLRNIQKLKTLNTVKRKLKSNGFMMER